MTTTEDSRAELLAQRYATLRAQEKRAVEEWPAERQAIVAEMRTFMTATEIANKLGISVTRVTRILRGKVAQSELARHLGHMTPAETAAKYGDLA